MAVLKAPPSRLVQDISRLDWSKYAPLAALRCLPAMALALAFGVFVHQPAGGIVVATGTLATGFGSFRKLQGSRLLPMILTGLGMFVAASFGTLAGESSPITIVIAGFLGLLYGLVLLFSEDASWIGLQCTIAFLVASAFPAYGWHALIRGALVLFGGVLQVGFLLMIWEGREVLSIRDDFRNCHPIRVLKILWGEIAPTLLRHVDHRLPQMRYAARLGLTLMLAVTLSHLLHQLNRYWLPMTALIVMKPDFYRTYTNAVARVLGTFAGIILASLLTHLLHPGEIPLDALVLVFAWTCFAVQKVNYGIFSCALTAFIVFLIATAGLPEVTVTANRLLDTALGSLLALGSRALGPKWDSLPPPAVSSSDSH
jgi:hypothetical protein